jgi:hypothetical protein
MADPALVVGAGKVAVRIAREHGQPDHCVEAHIVAEAELIILQARVMRARLLDANSSERTSRTETSDETRSREGSGENSVAAVAGDNDLGASDLASAYLARLPILSRLDRYEKTAVLRRQRALRSLCQTGFSNH